jgi:hypothetical protein
MTKEELDALVAMALNATEKDARQHDHVIYVHPRDYREYVKGTRPQPAPTTDARSRDVLPHAVEMVRKWGTTPAQHAACNALAELGGMTTDDIVAALKARAAAGVAKYGVPLRTHNGRDAREDARQELLDALMYLAQAEMEASG